MLWCLIALVISQLVGICHTLPEPNSGVNTCDAGYTSCEAAGVFDVTVDLVNLYANLVATINDDDAGLPIKRDASPSDFSRNTVTVICCVESMQCLSMDQTSIPFCWDKFTTNVYLPGGAYGTIVTGDFTFPSGQTINLMTGQFDNGTNIYAGQKSEQPNSATMTVPRQWTGTGVGSAIPASVLGDVATYRAPTTTTIGIVTNITGVESSYESTTTYFSAVDTPMPTESASDTHATGVSSTTTPGTTVLTATKSASEQGKSSSSNTAHSSTGATNEPAPSTSAGIRILIRVDTLLWALVTIAIAILYLLGLL